MVADALSPVSTLCLAILYRGDRTGYEIKKESVEGDYSYFVDASYGSIYPALARLAGDGYVTVREELQSGRPSRKIYAITDAGRAILVEALSLPPSPDVFRSRFLLVAKFALELPVSVVESAVAERRRELVAELDHLRAMCPDEPGTAGAWITGYGVACLSASLAYLDAHSERLVAMAGRPVEGAANRPVPVPDAAE